MTDIVSVSKRFLELVKNLIIGISLSRLDADVEYMGSARRKELARQVGQPVTVPAGISLFTPVHIEYCQIRQLMLFSA